MDLRAPTRSGGRRRGSGASTMLGAALEIPGDNGFVDRGRILSAGDAAAEEGAGSPDRGSGGKRSGDAGDRRKAANTGSIWRGLLQRDPGEIVNSVKPRRLSTTELCFQGRSCFRFAEIGGGGSPAVDG